MRYPKIFQPSCLPKLIKSAAIVAMLFLVAAACDAQTSPSGQPASAAWGQDLNKYPGLLEEFGRLFDKLQRNLQFPPMRDQSRLLPLLPGSTAAYAAFPNYGGVTRQALDIFRQELRESSVLRDWWQHSEIAESGPKFEDALEKFSQLSQYLGEEIVLSAAMDGQKDAQNPSFLVLAEIRKPGLKNVLFEMLQEAGGSSTPAVRVLDPRELATLEDPLPEKGLVVVVRPDFVVGASDVAALRRFNTRLNQANFEFASTPFGERLVQAYEGGATIVGAVDLQDILSRAPIKPENQATFQRSGFSDMKYAVWQRKSVAGQAVNQAELSFANPRHGVASWLGPPAPLESLTFASPNAIMAGTLVLKAPSQIFEDVRELATASNPNAFLKLAQWEQILNVSLRDDLLRYLGGEITLELDRLTPPNPVWKAIIQVNEPSRLQQTFAKLLGVAQFPVEQFEENSVTYYTVRFSAGKTTTDISYAFSDGYLVLASSRATAAEAVRLHRRGESLAKSQRFLASLPPGHSSAASALLYQDPVAMAALKLQQLAPELAQSLAQASNVGRPAVACAYGEQNAIREASSSGGADLGVVLITAAIAIPNLLRARIAANEASAVGTVRALNVAQIAYATAYPQKGYASDLATLGPNPTKAGTGSASHAGLIDDVLGNRTCTAGTWCVKNGFRFTIANPCKQQHPCKEFLVVAAPISSSTGGKNFCSASDAVIRFQTGPPLASPPSVSECRAWPQLQ